jgi:peptidyl-prolyl cis-trans isomerase A (cyclophilin A)
VIQAGGYTTGPVKKEGQLPPITLESNKGLPNTRGTVTMARTSAPNSATSEFFINVAGGMPDVPLAEVSIVIAAQTR